MRDLTVEHIAVASLRPYLGNARTHWKKQLKQIARSIEQFGFTNPVLISLVGFDGAYSDRIVARFESFTGKQARLEESGQSFEDAAAKRRAEVASLVAPAEELA